MGGSKKFAVKVMIEALDDGDRKAAKKVQKQFELNEDDVAVDLAVLFALLRACRNGRLEIAQWLTKTFNLVWKDAYDNDHRALVYAVQRRHFEVAMWLVDTFYD